MIFTKRKEVYERICAIKKILDIYTEKDLAEFLDEYLGNDIRELNIKKGSAGLEKLQNQHNKLPYGYVYKGTYYLKEGNFGSRASEENGAIILNESGRWNRFTKQYIGPYIRKPYKDKDRRILLGQDDCHVVYSKEEANNLLEQ